MIPSHSHDDAVGPSAFETDSNAVCAAVTMSTVSVQDTAQGISVHEITRHEEPLICCEGTVFVETSDIERTASSNESHSECDAPTVIVTESEPVELSEVTADTDSKQNDPPLEDATETARPVCFSNDETALEHRVIDNGLLLGLEPSKVHEAASNLHVPNAAAICAQKERDACFRSNPIQKSYALERSPQHRAMTSQDVLPPVLPSFMDLKRRQV
jgi:hypothetical protein